MRSAIPAQERPARNVLTVGVNCANRTPKHAASVTAYSVLPACPSIQHSTPKLHQQTTEFGSEKELKTAVSWLRASNKTGTGQCLATIDVAQRTGIPLKIAGDVQPMYHEYFERKVKP